MKENGGRKRMEKRDGEEERWKKSKDKKRLKIEEWRMDMRRNCEGLKLERKVEE